MRQANISLSALKGDTWEGASFTITVNGGAIDLSGASIEMPLRDDNTGDLVDTLSTGDGDILITGANTFSIAPFVVVYSSKMKFDIKITFSDGSIKTYIKGIFCILEDL